MSCVFNFSYEKVSPEDHVSQRGEMRQLTRSLGR